MKKILTLLIIMLATAQMGFAQFEKGKVYMGGAMDAAGFSYDSTNKFSIGLGARGGYMISDNVMLVGDVNFDYRNKEVMEAKIGAAGRYFIVQNGLFLQAGLHYVHEFSNFNSLQINPEVGYCFFLGQHVALEPSLYYDMSLNSFSDKSRAGCRVNVVVYFDCFRKL